MAAKRAEKSIAGISCVLSTRVSGAGLAGLRNADTRERARGRGTLRTGRR